MTHLQNGRAVGAVVVALGLWATAAAGQPGATDPLEQAKIKQRIAEQKAERDIAEAMVAADQQLRFNNRPRAVETLKAAKRDLQFAAVTEAARTRLTNALEAKIAAIEGRPAVVAAPKAEPRSPEAVARQKELEEKAAAEFKEVVAGLKYVQKAEEAGETAKAGAEIARLTKLYPDNPSVIALGQNGGLKTRLNDAIALQNEQRARWFAVQKGIVESSMPAIRDVEFPKDWAEKTKRRVQTIELSAKEKKIMEALDKPISVAFRDRPFEEALQDLSNMLDQPLLLDKKSLTDLETDLKKGSTLEAKGLSGRTVLRSLLATHGLTFVVQEETIQIVTVERARNLLATRVYYLGDLVKGTGAFGGPEWGPFINNQQMVENVQVLMNTIQKSIDPLSWRENGGPGTITFHVPSMSIIVRTSTEVHHSLSRSFGAGR